MQTRGGGGQKSLKFCRRHMYTAPNWRSSASYCYTSIPTVCSRGHSNGQKCVILSFSEYEWWCPWDPCAAACTHIPTIRTSWSWSVHRVIHCLPLSFGRTLHSRLECSFILDGKMAKKGREWRLEDFPCLIHQWSYYSINDQFHREVNKGLYVVARNFFLLLLNCSAWPCLGLA